MKDENKQETRQCENMTNREYLNTLSDSEFTELVLAKAIDLLADNFDEISNPYELTVRMSLDFENWLEEEYKED